jgi:hypothetical protein
MTAQNNEHQPTVQTQQPLTNPLAALNRAIEEANAFKVQMSERLKKLLQQHGVLHARNDALEQENRTLKARLSASESDVKRLTKDNDILNRNQQMLDVAIQTACGTFMETTAFVSEATNSSISSLPLPMPRSALGDIPTKPVVQLQPQIALSRPQPVSSAAAPVEEPKAPMPTMKPIDAYVAQSAPKSLVDVSDDDDLKMMTDEIDRILAQDIGGASGETADAQTEAATESKAA